MMALCSHVGVLALIYTVPAKVIACSQNRQLSWRRLRMSSAALYPGHFSWVRHFSLCWQAVD